MGPRQGSGRVGSGAAGWVGVRVRHGVGEGLWALRCSLEGRVLALVRAGLARVGLAAGAADLERTFAPEAAKGLASALGRVQEAGLAQVQGKGPWETPSWSS